MTGPPDHAGKAATSKDGRGNGRGNGHRDRVWDLVSAYGPDITGLCRSSAALMSGVAGMGLSAGPPGTVPSVRFFSDTASSQLESAQVTLDEGPCRDATATRRPVLVADLAVGSWRQRWPWFTPAALKAGVRAVFALPLHAGGVRHDGAVDLYRHTPGPLNSADRLAATTFTAAVTELLTLERHDLDLTGVFTRGWRDSRPENRADATDSGASAAAPPVAGSVLLACWFGPAMLGPIRARIHALATGQGLHSGHAHRFVLAVHEAAANVVRHGGGHGQLLLWRRDGRLWCEISDHGPGKPAPDPSGGHPADPTAPSWSGMQIIQRACTSVDITTDSSGTRLLLSHRLDPRSRP
ncbi:ATP-binding protein [Actinoplanes sp. NPDC023936]|uniref:ATP-binding protein n=1 Tax=Actinoplanes sp. NPDC023936 TaxID=3154910 RepID=UPI0033E92B16